MKKLIIALFLTLNFLAVFGQKMNVENQKVVSDFINCLKYQKKEKLSNRILFPLKRKYPLTEIKNKQEFLKRYDEVFDEKLIKMIINSKPSADWSSAGWRGIMLFRGDLWLSYDGTLISLNYQSKAEGERRDELIKIEKNKLYGAIKAFRQPIHILETAKYRIRIDDMGDGNYRYVSWLLKNKMSDKPDLVLEKGKLIADGSGGNHKYEFRNGDYTYDCAIVVMGEKNAPPALLTIYRDDKEILSHRAKII